VFFPRSGPLHYRIAACRTASLSHVLQFPTRRPSGSQQLLSHWCICGKALNTPPFGLHLRSSYRLATHQPAFAPSRISLSMKALHSALRAPLAQHCLRFCLQQPAFVAGCLHCSSLHSHAAASRLSLQALHTSPEGLRLRCSASLARSRHQPASSVCCSRCSKPAFAASCILLSTQRCTPP